MRRCFEIFNNFLAKAIYGTPTLSQIQNSMRPKFL